MQTATRMTGRGRTPPIVVAILAAIGYSMAAPSPAAGTTWMVDGPTSLIQPVLNMTAPNDTVLLAPGTYGEYLTLPLHSLTLIGQGGPNMVELTEAPGAPAQFYRLMTLRATSNVDLRIQGMRFRNGVGRGVTGGALLVEGPVDVDLRQVEFVDNSSYGLISSSGSGGAAYIKATRSVTMEDCLFSGNGTSSGAVGHADAYGGAMTLQSALVRIANTSFVRNSTGGNDCGTIGGALSLISPDARLVGCRFEGNEANFGAAISGSGTVTLVGCEFWENVCAPGYRYCYGRAGSVVAMSGNITILGCRFVENSLGSPATVLQLQGSSLDLSLSTIAYNGGANYPALDLTIAGGGIARVAQNLLANNAGGGIKHNLIGVEAFQCNLLFDLPPWPVTGVDFIGQNGNTRADPLFCDPGSKNLTVAGNSPCLDNSLHNPTGCGAIGTVQRGCDADTVEPSTWSAIKSLVR